MNSDMLYSQQQANWMSQPDQYGYPPPQRSGRVIDLSVPTIPHVTLTSNSVDPEYCHRSLHEHRQALKQRYRRMIRDQMKAEEESWGYQRQQGLEPFPWGAFEMKLPLLPTLNRAMHESGGNTVRAWEMFDRRSRQEKEAEGVTVEKREAEVRRLADEMIRNETEAKEDKAMRELLEELPMFTCPDIRNTVSFASIIGNIQEHIPFPISDITISRRGNPHLQIELSQVVSWVQQDCNQGNLEHVVLISADELDTYCSSIADRIFYHLSANFRKQDYLRKLRNTQARLRKLKQANSELRVENERLRSGVKICNSQVGHDLGRAPLFEPSAQRYYSHPSRSLRQKSGVEISNNQVEHNQGRVPLFEPSVHRHYLHPPQPQRQEYHPPQSQRQEYHPPQSQKPRFQQPQITWAHQRSTATPPNGSDMAVGHQNNTIEQNGGISQMDHIMEYSPMEMEEIRRRRGDSRRANSMPPHNRGRTRASDFHTPLPKLDPATGYGKVVAVDEIGPIYDYSNKLDEVSMRGGAGPYSLLEDSDGEGDDQSDGKATKFANITPSLGRGTLNQMKRFVDDDDDEDDDSFSTHSSLKFTKYGDTRSNDPNNQLWGGGPLSSSGIGRPSAALDNSGSRRNDRGRRRRNGATNIAPGLVPFTPKADPYAEVPHGFQFSWHQAENAPLEKTWTTLDPKTGAVKYEEGSQGAQEENPQDAHMWHPSDARNTPLAATFGTSRVVLAAEVKERNVPGSGGLTAKSLQRLDRQSRRDKAESIDDYIDITSTPGSPNAPPSEPSVVEFHSASAQGGMAIDKTVEKQPGRIDADVRKNFMDNINAMHDARPAPGSFERRNQGWIAKTKSPVSYVNEFGEGNVVEVKMKMETRTRMMNERGEYDGKDLGQVKKRYLRGFAEMIQARDDEMVRATKEYREWQAMSLEDRMERLTLIRQPIDLWKGEPGADEADQHELHYLPAFYKRRVSRRKDKQRIRAILAEKAKQKQRDDASASLGTAGTGDTLDTLGVLGDCDDLPARGTSDGSRTPRLGDESLQGMLRRALDVDPSRGSRSRSRSTSKTASVVGSMAAESGFRLPGRVHNKRHSRLRSPYSGGSGTGNSVAGPRQSRPLSSRPIPSPAASPNAWCSSEAGSNAPSTVRGLRNSPLEGYILNDLGTGRSSDGTNAANELAALYAAYDDSPELKIPTDTDTPSSPNTALGVVPYTFAVENMEKRGRVVTVRLHAVQESHGAPGDMLPKFTPGTIANKVFGGVVQEFQLHPEKRTAVVVFVHPREARSFVHHVRNVREKGTEHDIRDLQIEASWFRGAESRAVVPAQTNLLKHSLFGKARRCILLSCIPKEKSHRVVSQELSACFDKILVRISLITPQQNYILQSEGRQALVEFANLKDAMRAYDDLNAGLIAGYENANPEYRNEPTEKRATARDYCGCFGCEEKRGAKSKEREENKRKRDEQMREDEYEMSSYSDTASD